ncbi:unnamed protein product [Meloidogyne enterolobii]|uniref:Uncharacterized protein n=1 Tax=Meloidogyne enterolobii TaxID=390850 RepID=A0ACB0ZGG8_MELEN
MRKRCCNSSGVNGMASTSALVSRALLLLTVALLLLECVVWCDMVGKQSKDSLKEASKIRRLLTRLSLLMALIAGIGLLVFASRRRSRHEERQMAGKVYREPYPPKEEEVAAKEEKDGKETTKAKTTSKATTVRKVATKAKSALQILIFLMATHATKGCSMDLLTKNRGIQLDFTVTGNLMECLTDAGVKGTNEVHDERVGDENMFPYTFSLQEGRLVDLLDKGPKTGAPIGCSKECKSEGNKGRHGQCLLSTEFAVAFGRRGDKMLYNMHILGEPRIWYCASATKMPESTASVTVNFDQKFKGWQVPSKHGCGSQSALDYDRIAQSNIYCTNPDVLRKAEEWEIKDEAHKDEFKYLFTLNVLPLKVVPAHSVKMQALDPGKMIDGNKFPKCELSLRLW